MHCTPDGSSPILSKIGVNWRDFTIRAVFSELANSACRIPNPPEKSSAVKDRSKPMFSIHLKICNLSVKEQSVRYLLNFS